MKKSYGDLWNYVLKNYHTLMMINQWSLQFFAKSEKVASAYKETVINCKHIKIINVCVNDLSGHWVMETSL